MNALIDARLVIWAALLLLCTLWPYFADGANGPRLNVELDGIGYDAKQAPGAAHPEEAAMHRDALADAQGKCDALFGPGSTLEVVWKPKYHESREDGGSQVYARYEGSFRCTAGTADRDFLLARLMGIVLHPERQPRFHPAAVTRLVDHATWAIGFMGEMAVPILLAHLDEPRFEILRHVMSALGNTRTGSPAALDALLARLDDSREEVREEAAATLTYLAPSPNVDAGRLVERLLPVLESDQVERRRLAVQILGGLGSRGKPAKTQLWDVIRRHPDDWLPPNAVDALADIGVDPEDAPTVLSLYALPGAHPVLRAELVRLLGDLKERGRLVVPFLFGIVQEDYTQYHEIFEHSAFLEAVVALGKIGPTDDETLNARVEARLSELSRTDNRFQKEAGEALAAYQAPQRKAEEQRQARLRAVERDRRDDEISRLSAQAPADVLKSVLPLLKDARVDERVKGLEVIERLGSAAADAKNAVFEIFEQFPGAPEPEFITAGSALHAMGIKADDVRHLTALLRLPGLHPLRRAMVARLLGELGREARSAIPALLEGMPEDLLKLDAETASARTNPVDGDIMETVKALGRIGPSDDTAVARAVSARLGVIIAYDDEFNAPTWLQRAAQDSLTKLSAPGSR